LTLKGKTFPSAQVTVMESGAVIGTTTSNPAGMFSKTLYAMMPGVHDVALHAVDAAGTVSQTTTLSVSLALGEDTTVSNIILSPTLQLTTTEIHKGNTITIYGYAASTSTVVISITTLSTHSVSVNNDGFWTYTLATSDLTLGDYSVFAHSTVPPGYQSVTSQTRNFKIIAAPTTSAATATPGTATSAVTAAPTKKPSSFPTTSYFTQAPRQVRRITSVPTVKPPLKTATRPLATAKKVSPIPTLPAPLKSFFEEAALVEAKTAKNKTAYIIESRASLIKALTKWVTERNKKVKPKTKLKCDFDGDGKCTLKDLSIMLHYVKK
jgi:hypothetical protein